MTEQLFLTSGGLEGLREAGSLGRPVHVLYPQLKVVLENELGSDSARFFAEPVLDEQNGRLDWYSRGNNEPVALSSLPQEQRRVGYQRLLAAYDQVETVADRYIHSGDTNRIQLGKALRAALTPIPDGNVFLVDDQPVITFWGFFQDGAWDGPMDLARWREMLRRRIQPEPEVVASAPPLPPRPVPAITEKPKPALSVESATRTRTQRPRNLRWLWWVLAALLLLLLALHLLATFLSREDSAPEANEQASRVTPTTEVESTATPPPSEAEGQEFATRMAAEEATTGEITITLIWNNRNDLDLMILCPSGEQLYYQQPSRCGGKLDVDKNADNELTERPVENIFWPSGEAPAGTYRVAVKYYARKDESVPPETEFRLQLLRAGQTTFFDGVVSPGELKRVTEFTVAR